jgi:transposase
MPTRQYKIKYKKYSNEVNEFVIKNIINVDKFNIGNLITKLNSTFTDHNYSRNNVHYILRKNNITYKRAHKKVIIDKSKYIERVNKLKEQVKNIKEDNIISIDESHFVTNMTNNYGYNYKGSRVTFEQKKYTKKTCSLILGISNKKIIHSCIKTSTVKSDDFFDFIVELIDKLEGINHTLLMDNSSIHKTKLLKDYIESKNHNILFNVPYNPETNPIEMVFHKIKSLVRLKPNNLSDDLNNSINESIECITSNDLGGYFKHSFE